MKVAIGQKVIVRKLEREDVDKMQNWGTHHDPLFFHYNFPTMSKIEGDEWYRIKNMKFKRKSFAIENKEGKVIGYLCIRDIRWIKKEAELGIVLDPDYIGMGYGTEAIEYFLKYYFKDLKMSEIHLRTAKFNKRAIQCYLDCGFKVVGEKDDLFEDQTSEIFYNPLYQDLRQYFKVVEGKKITKYIYMTLTKEGFFNKN